MAAPLTVSSLFENQCQRLGLRWLAGRSGEQREIRRPEGSAAGAPMVGRLSLIGPQCVQVLGEDEIAYLQNPAVCGDPLARLFALAPDLIIISESRFPPESLCQRAESTATPLLASPLASGELINLLHYALSSLLGDKLVVPGVFMEVIGIGVLLTGKSGIGKSELALELLTRGQRLIADDAPEFSRIAPDILNGTCPEPLRDFLEVRGLGVLNVRSMFGDSAIKPSKYLRLIVNLEHMSDQALAAVDRLRGCQDCRRILGVEIPVIGLPVAPGRNLAVLVEAAVRNHLLRMRGYHAADDFIGRQHRQIEHQSP
jgi:HPr kinase/phosphorylase